MTLSLPFSHVVFMIVGTILAIMVSPNFSSAVAASVWDDMPSIRAWSSPISKNSSCSEWTSWAPPRSDPALVMQVVTEDYLDLEVNFVRLMELNSVFTRHHIYLMCMDNASVNFFASLGIRCVPLGTLQFNTVRDLWRMRIRALSCLVMEGYNVIMSDSDALWLRDPMDYFNLPAVKNSSVVSSRGNFPTYLSTRWGATMCLGFIFFRATGPAMDKLQESIKQLVLRFGDDQIATNKAVDRLGITWDEDSDMRFSSSTGLGRGTIETLSDDDGPFVVTLLPHVAFTRVCASTPISNETVVAHCHSTRKVGRRVSWMQKEHLWLKDSSTSWT